MKIRELPFAEKPVQRIARNGGRALSQIELLMAITGLEESEKAAIMLKEPRALVMLASSSVDQLTESWGLTKVQAARLAASFELWRRLAFETIGELVQITKPSIAAAILHSSIGWMEQEAMCVIGVDTKNRIKFEQIVSQGSMNVAYLNFSDLVREPIRRACPAFVIGHNHPSGDPTPSPEDILMTRKINDVAEQLDLQLLDHIIVSPQGNFVSLREKGYMDFARKYN